MGGVAQLGARLTGSQEVRGSIPLISTMKVKPDREIRSGFFYFNSFLSLSEQFQTSSLPIEASFGASSTSKRKTLITSTSGQQKRISPFFPRGGRTAIAQNINIRKSYMQSQRAELSPVRIIVKGIADSMTMAAASFAKAVYHPKFNSWFIHLPLSFSFFPAASLSRRQPPFPP